MVSSISIEAIMYSNFIKYPKLAEMTQQEFAGLMLVILMYILM